MYVPRIEQNQDSQSTKFGNNRRQLGEQRSTTWRTEFAWR